MPVFSIDIEAYYAKFTDAMTAIEQKAKEAAKGIEGSFSPLNSVFAGLASAISVGALVELVKRSIDAADHLNDLSKKTGVAVDVLGGLGFAAAQAGGDLESIAAAAGKLNKSIAEAGSGNKEASEAFRALGISVEDGAGKLKSADKVMAEVADKFANFSDGPEKAAIALRLFGKAGADIIPLLDDGGEALRKNIEYFQKYSGVTQEIAEKSSAFNDTLEKIKLLSGAAGNQIAAELLPVLQALADQMVEVKESSTGFSAVGKAISTVIEAVAVLGVNTSYVFKQVGNEIGGITAQLAALARLDFKAFSSIGEQMKEDAQRARAAVDKQTEAILNPKVQTSPEKPKEAPKRPAPRLPGTGTDGEKQKLEGQLKALERQNERERELLSARNEFLQDAYQKDLIAIGDYYAARKAASDEALAAQIANIDKEVELLRARRAKDASEQAENESKIKDLIEKKANLQQKAGLDAIKDIQAQANSYDQLKRAIEDVNTQLLEQQGLSGQAAARRFDEQNRQLRQRFESELAAANNKPDAEGVTTVRGSRGLVALDKLREITIAQANLNDLQAIGARIQSDLGIATDRAQIAAQTGAATELESLRAVSDARAQAVVDLQAVADAYTEMAAKTGNPAIIQHAKELQVEVEKLANSADLVREKFQDAFATPFESFFEKLASGTASLKDLIKGLFSDIASEFTKIASHNLADSLFGKQGPLGGIVDFASQAFGGKSAVPQVSGDILGSVAKATSSTTDAAASAAAATALTSLATVTATTDASMVTLATTTVATDTAMVTLAASATIAAAALEAAAAAAASSAAGDSAGGIIGLFGDFASFAANGNAYSAGNLIPFANGGIPGVVSSPTTFPMTGGRTGLMGEAGPEAIMPLGRDSHGQLAVRMLDDHGAAKFLPLARDAAGRLAVRAANDSKIQKFAVGGVFGSSENFRTNASGAFRIANQRQISTAAASMAVPSGDTKRGGDTFITNVPQGTSQESASQIAARTAATVARANRRNN